MSVSKMHSDEVETDSALVKQLLISQFPQWAELPIKPVLSAGTDNALYKLGEDMVVRLPRIEKAVNHIDKEMHWLPRLAPLLPVAIPTPLVKGTRSSNYPFQWSIYRWLKGEIPVVDDIKEPQLLTKDLAKFITALHNVHLEEGPSAKRGVPLSTQDSSTRKAIEGLRGVIDTEAATALWNEALYTSEWRGELVWVHGDLLPMNLLTLKGRLSAVIDWGGVGVGDPACDLIIAWTLLSSDMRSIFRNILQVDDATWARGRGWAFSIALIQLPYYQDTNLVLADNARHVIKEILTEYKTAKSLRC